MKKLSSAGKPPTWSASGGKARRPLSRAEALKVAAARVRIARETQSDDAANAARWAAEIERCRTDCAYFIDTYCIIDDAQGHGEGDGTMPFRLWEAQRDVVGSLMTESLLIILKARQLGISWLCCAYVLWLCLFHNGKSVLLFSQGEDEANEMLRRVQVMYERLAAGLKDALPRLVKDNTGVMVWANESRVRSMPATQKAGRSFTASTVVMDEAAHMMWADKLYTAVKPTMDGGGQLVILSTANGLGNLFHNIWTKSVAAKNKFKTVFLPWWSRPGRTQEWYDAKVSEESDPARVRQEYPANANEAFLASGRLRFPIEWITAQAPNVGPGIDSRLWPVSLQHIPGFTAYVLPVPGRRYLIPADVAEGLEHGDYSTAPVLDAETCEEVASIHGHWEPDTFTRYLVAIGYAYNEATIIPERNNHGHAVLATLRTEGYPAIGFGMDESQGWLSNIKTKPHSIDILATALRDGTVIIHTQAILDELQVYKVLKNGKTGASDSYNDDRVMALAIGLAYIELNPPAAAGTVGGKREDLAPMPDMTLPQPSYVIPGQLL